MQLTDLYPEIGSTKRRKRVGRGPGCHGKTSGRGENGQNSRSGGGKAPGFEGGQTPWYRRLPKFKGFKNPFRTDYTEVSLDVIAKCAENTSEITPETLLEARYIKNLRKPVKVLGNGSIDRPVSVRMHKFTQSAQDAIEKAGGKTEVI